MVIRGGLTIVVKIANEIQLQICISEYSWMIYALLVLFLLWGVQNVS